MDEDYERLLSEPLPMRIRTVMDLAHDNGWRHTFTSLVTRWSPEMGDQYGVPWYSSWYVVKTEKGWSYRFHNARAANFQKLTFGDLKIYLENPEVIHPEPPEGT